MNPRPIRAESLPDFTVKVWFSNGEFKIFDTRYLHTKGIFQSLKDPVFFSQVCISNNTISWPGGLDICPDTVFENSFPAD